MILNNPCYLLYRRRIARFISRDHSFSKSAPLDRFDAADIFAAASDDVISVDDARWQLQSHIAVDVMIEGLDKQFADSITSEGCAIFHQFVERKLARLPLTLGDVYSAAMIVCDETLVRCKKQSPKGTLSVVLVFCFAVAFTSLRVKSSHV